MEGELINLSDIALRLDADEEFTVVYKVPIQAADGSVAHETRSSKLLDVDEASDKLYVTHNGDVIWIFKDEVVELKSGD